MRCIKIQSAFLCGVGARVSRHRFSMPRRLFVVLSSQSAFVPVAARNDISCVHFFAQPQSDSSHRKLALERLLPKLARRQLANTAFCCLLRHVQMFLDIPRISQNPCPLRLWCVYQEPSSFFLYTISSPLFCLKDHFCIQPYAGHKQIV